MKDNILKSDIQQSANQAYDSAQLEADHLEGLKINLDMDISEQEVIASKINSLRIADALIMESMRAAEPTDAEILDVYIDAFGGDLMSATARLRRFSL